MKLLWKLLGYPRYGIDIKTSMLHEYRTLWVSRRPFHKEWLGAAICSELQPHGMGEVHAVGCSIMIRDKLRRGDCSEEQAKTAIAEFNANRNAG